MVNLLKRLFAKPEPAPFAIAVGRHETGDQITVDAQRIIIGNDLYYAPLPPWARPDLYRQLYNTNELATGAANLLERFIVTAIRPVGVPPDVARTLTDIFKRIDLQGAMRMLCRNGQIYGYGLLEAVYADDFSDILRLVCPSAFNVRVKPDVHGNVLSYLQLPGFAPWLTATNKFGQIEIPAQGKTIPYVRDPVSTYDYYGSSLYQSALNRFIQLETLITCQLNSAKRVGQPRFFIGVSNEGLTPEQYSARVADVKTAFAALGKQDAADIYMPPECTVNIIGAEANGRFREEIIQCIGSIVSALGIPASLLGVTVSTGGSENILRQQTIALMTLIQSQQESLAKSVNTHLMPMLARIYGLPDDCAIEFQRSRVIDTLLEAQADALEFQNQWNLVQKGIQTPGWLAEQCGVDELANPELFRQSLMVPQPTSNTPDAVKADSTTKVTDQRATGNTTL